MTRTRERTFGLIGPLDYPNPKEEGSFPFPRDFRDAPDVNDLKEGRYEVRWTAWERAESSDDGVFSDRPVDVASDRFQVDRASNVI